MLDGDAGAYNVYMNAKNEAYSNYVDVGLSSGKAINGILPGVSNTGPGKNPKIPKHCL